MIGLLIAVLLSSGPCTWLRSCAACPAALAVRRRSREQNRRGTFGRPPGEAETAGRAKGRGVLAGLARQEFGVAAGVIGIRGIEMRRAFDEGRSIAELAAQAGVPLEQIVSAVVSDATSTIERRLELGQMAQDEAFQVRARIPVWANRLVNFHKGDLSRLRR